MSRNYLEKPDFLLLEMNSMGFFADILKVNRSVFC